MPNYKTSTHRLLAGYEYSCVWVGHTKSSIESHSKLYHCCAFLYNTRKQIRNHAVWGVFSTFVDIGNSCIVDEEMERQALLFVLFSKRLHGLKRCQVQRHELHSDGLVWMLLRHLLSHAGNGLRGGAMDVHNRSLKCGSIHYTVAMWWCKSCICM